MPFAVPAAILCTSSSSIVSLRWWNQMARSSHYVIDSDSSATLVSALCSVLITPHR